VPKINTKNRDKTQMYTNSWNKPKKIKNSQNKVQNNPRYPQLAKRHQTE